MNRFKRLIHEAHRRSLWQVLAIYVIGAWVGYQVVLGLFEGLGLPSWVPGLAVVLFVIGLPIVLATAFVQEGAPGLGGASDPTLLPGLEHGAGVEAAPSASPPLAPARAPLGRLLTWRRSITAGVLAFAALGLGATGFMGMRSLGIGPMGTLVAKGVLDARDRIVLSDFQSQSSDSVLAATLTEALRVDLEQSPVVSLADPGFIREGLRRMERDSAPGLDPELARELAVREGLKAVLTGELNRAGSSFVLSARLLSTGGEVLASFRETAADSSEVLAAVDRLSRALRERVGESLRSIRGTAGLERVTTASLPALQKYSQAVRVLQERDDDRGIALLEDAVTLDSSFAMAWRKLGVAYSNRGDAYSKVADATTRAYRLRDRLSERERYLTTGSYHYSVTGDRAQAILAYQTLLETFPDDSWALNNLALLYNRAGRTAAAESLYHRALALDSGSVTAYRNLGVVQAQLGKYDEVEKTIEQLEARFPGQTQTAWGRAGLAAAQGDYEGAESQLRRLRGEEGTNALWRANTSMGLGILALLRGRHSEARRHWADMVAARPVYADHPAGALLRARDQAMIELALGDTAAAVARVLAAETENPLDGIESWEDRPYGELTDFWAGAGDADRARSVLERFVHDVPPDRIRGEGARAGLHGLRARIALAGGDPAEALRELRAQERLVAPSHDIMLSFARAFEAAEQPDSAAAYYRRYIELPGLFRFQIDGFELPRTYERLGELYERLGEPRKAAEMYAAFVELWRDGDPEVQPRVRAAQRALEGLLAEGG